METASGSAGIRGRAVLAVHRRFGSAGRAGGPRELTAADLCRGRRDLCLAAVGGRLNGGRQVRPDTGALCDWLETADGVRPGTVSANGSCVTWQTDAGHHLLV